ncbi:interferon alpha/beta receptor 1 isoform X1 [Ammospiza caudacuta]|uniref:interferon alpha/beta receptor 1 isoform X1 n=2 Tax=Ammospiza caudacuta TaxID=2857398 RepID=UPI00273875BC|nr:interferon alpha/beta receptor 1 isoform X1 [Ammospiza caudacuta]
MAGPGAGGAAEPEEPGDGWTAEPWGRWTAERRRLWVPGGLWLAAVLPLLLVPLPCAGQSSLPSPENVQVHVVNTNFTLSWDYRGSEPGVTFCAQFQWPELEPTGWQELPGCQAVAGTSCDFSLAISEYYDAHYVRVRAQAGPLVSPWSQVLEMVPEQVAQIGPPGLELQSTNGVVKVMVSPPEANQRKKMWINDLTFKYNLVFWENSSHAQPQNKRIFPVDTIDDLAPDSTYCFKVQANLPSEGKQGLFSPPSCVKTTQKVNDLLCATNLSVLALNMEFHLLWSSQESQDVTYNVQYLLGFLKDLNDDYSDKWLSVPGCESITSSWCNFSSIITGTGFYHLRVQAREGHNKSCFSREVKVDPLKTNGIGPPGVRLDLSDTLLHILISPPGGDKDEFMMDHYDLSYRILYWKNSSDTKEEVKQKEVRQTIATVPDVSPSSLYCVQVQAFSEPYNKSSAYSQQQCILTPAGTPLALIIAGIFLGALLVVLLVAAPLVFVFYQAYNKIKYVFFPSCQPPLNIEGFGAQPLSSPYLSAAAEEAVERCCVIESMVTEEGNHIVFSDYKHSTHSSRDSGNYSNDDNTSGSKGSKETLEKEVM